jgi:Flp pilus assembly protein TadG
MRRFVKRLYRDQRGGAVVEAALVLPVVLVLLYAALEFALLSYANSTVDRLTRTLATAVERDVNSQTGLATLRAELCQGLSAPLTCETTIIQVAPISAALNADFVDQYVRTATTPHLVRVRARWPRGLLLGTAALGVNQSSANPEVSKLVVAAAPFKTVTGGLIW